MIDKRTVFVLGAGASCPYGFPTGKDLREVIIKGFLPAYNGLLKRRKNTSIEGINKGYPDTKVANALVTRFDASNTVSIDLFLSRHPDLQEIGKMAILLSILDAERRSHFGLEAQKTEEDWYFYLFNELTRTFIGKDGYKEFGKSKIAFVTFNYDRSLEYFLSTSLLSAFQGADPASVGDQIRQVPIVHVYGQVAPLMIEFAIESGLPVNLTRGSGLTTLPLCLGYRDRVHYGRHMGDFTTVNLLECIKNLYIIREGRDYPQLEKAREEIRKADRIFFLGFGYADENLEALGFPDVVRKEQTIYGTAMGWTNKEIMAISDKFAKALNKAGSTIIPKTQAARIRNCDCVALLREYL